MSVSATRRTDRRAETMVDIKAAAWADMRSSGTPDCSLRAVARRLGMAPSALYRYFASRDDLLTALIVDAHDDLADTLALARSRARAAVPANQPGEVFVAVASAYRRWALAEPLRYRLIYGSPVGNYVGNDQTTAAVRRSTQVLLDVMADIVADDALDTERLEGLVSPGAGRSFERWSAVLAEPLPPVALAAALDCYASLHGAIELEVNRHLPAALLGNEEVFLGTMRRVVGTILR